MWEELTIVQLPLTDIGYINYILLLVTYNYTILGIFFLFLFLQHDNVTVYTPYAHIGSLVAESRSAALNAAMCEAS